MVKALAGALLQLMDSEQLENLLRQEMRARHDEGCAVEGFREALEQENSRGRLVDLYHRLLQAPARQDFQYVEPESLAELRRLRPDGPRATVLNLAPEELYDRIHGGWLGRVAGCVLGKPVEPFGYRGKIIEYLTLAGSYPLTNYIPRLDPMPVDFIISPGAEGNFLSELNGAPDDDDTDYTILALHILESHGLEFTTGHVAAEWLSHLTYHKIWTAERAVYRNLILGVAPDQAAHLLNPEREYIGARIRADAYGLVAPGNPELAATLAFRDAALSHTKNGIYSAMFMAACIAWAFVTHDLDEIIRVGLSEIPANSRLAEALQEVLSLRREVADWESAYERLLEKCAYYHPVHAINNTVWVALAMLYGQGDLEKTICMATLCGFDTDCNAANAGCVLGVLNGAQALPSKWTAPLHDTLRSAVSQFGEMRISDLARRTTVVAGNHITHFSDQE